MRVLPSYGRKQPVNDFSDSAIQVVDDTHRLADGAGAPIVPLEPISRKVRPTSKRSRRISSDTHESQAAVSWAIGDTKPNPPQPGGDDHVLCETQLAPVIATIQELWRRRQSWHRAEKSLTLQAKAVCRRYVGGDKDEADKLFATVEGQRPTDTQSNDAPVAVAILPLLMARETVGAHRASVEKELTKLAKTLPIYPWCAALRGLGALSLAGLVGECGNIGGYKSASAVWKRMGLAVINGERQRRVSGADALVHGYSPERRAIAWNIGVSLMRAQKVGQPYRDFYDSEKAKQLGKGLVKGHAHNRACRHMTKRLLAELYGAWRAASR